MNEKFFAEIMRATSDMRSGDTAGAMAIIQAALAAGGLAGATGAGFTAPRIPLGARDITLPDGLGGLPKTRSRMPFGEVIRTLSQGRRERGLSGAMRSHDRPVARVPEPPLPEGAEFRDLTFTCAAGTRRYRLYIPASSGSEMSGLILMLHGCTQTPEDFATGTRMNAVAEARALLVAYPAQTGSDNSMSCWNWFRPGDQIRDAGEPAILAGLTEHLRDEFAIPHDRIFAAGLSAGGAMAAILGETYPDLYAAIGVHSGLAYGSASDVASAFGAMKGQEGVSRYRVRTGMPEQGPRVIVFHGTADTTVHPSNADRIIAGQGEHLATMERLDLAPSGTERSYARRIAKRADGTVGLEYWLIDGARHAWAGGDPLGSYTDPRGPDASAEMARFFLGQAADGGRVTGRDPLSRAPTARCEPGVGKGAANNKRDGIATASSRRGANGG